MSIIKQTVTSGGKWVKTLVKTATNEGKPIKTCTKIKDVLKTETKGVTDTFTSRFILPTAKSEITNVEQFLTALRSSKYARPINIPKDIPSHLDFSKGSKTLIGRSIVEKNETGAITREYISSNGKDLNVLKIYDLVSGKPKYIINYETKYGKRFVTYAKEVDPITKREIKHQSYWEKSENLRGIVSKNDLGQEVNVAFKENGSDIKYVLNNGKTIYG